MHHNYSQISNTVLGYHYKVFIYTNRVKQKVLLILYSYFRLETKNPSESVWNFLLTKNLKLDLGSKDICFAFVPGPEFTDFTDSFSNWNQQSYPPSAYEGMLKTMLYFLRSCFYYFVICYLNYK